MTARGGFTVFHHLDAREIEHRVLDDGRQVLQITDQITLTVRPDWDDLPAIITGLRHLAARATEMADALDGAS